MCQSSQEPSVVNKPGSSPERLPRTENNKDLWLGTYTMKVQAQGGKEPVGWADILGTDLQTCLDPQLREQFLQKEATLDWVLK